MEIKDPHRVLVGVIDRNESHRAQIARGLMSFYRVSGHGDLREGLATLRQTPPLAILVDENVGGAEAVKRIRGDQLFGKTVLIATSDDRNSDFLAQARSLGCHASLVKPFPRATAISLISSFVNKSVEDGWKRLSLSHRRALQSSLDTFNGISDLIDKGEAIGFAAVRDACSPLVDAVQRNDFKAILNGVKGHDNYSYVHSLRVATFLSLFGHAMGLKGDDLLVLSSGGLLHDIGKMSIPHEVLNKPGRLDADELVVMRSHVDGSVAYLAQCPTMPKGVAVIAGQHHEKLDGTGYPKGLKGGELNELARMAAIVDVFSALTDRRCYKPPMEPEKALDIIKTDMGTHLDQSMLRLFVDLLLSGAADAP